MDKIKVLFVCIHNSARSQMAEAFVNKYGEGKITAESAGLEPGKLNPVVIKAMQEIGTDISKNQTKSVYDFWKANKLYSYVITVCDETSGERCPVFPGITQRLHWGFEDPSSISGTDDEKLAGTRMIRDQIEEKVKQWIKTLS